jgi:hypothetical protein
MRTLALALLVISAVRTSGDTSRTCYYLTGPRSGSTQYFAAFAPIPLGSACNDGVASAGIAVRDGLRNPRGRFSMDRDQPACSDSLGYEVAYRMNPDIPKSGLATVVENQPTIFLRPADLQAFSLPVRRFLYAHECGHHALGQILSVFFYHANIGPQEELAADCFAAQELRRIGLLSPSDWEETLKFLATVPGDPTTLPGPRRVRELRDCMP